MHGWLKLRFPSWPTAAVIGRNRHVACRRDFVNSGCTEKRRALCRKKACSMLYKFVRVFDVRLLASVLDYSKAVAVRLAAAW